MTMLSRRAFLGTCSGLGAAALAGCTPTPGTDDAPTGGQDGAGSTSDSLAKVSFVLDYSPNVNHTGIYVAIDQGFFAEEGIEVEIVPVPADGSDALIGAGGADMGLTYQDYIANSLSSANPLPYTAVAAVVQHNTSGIMSRAEDGIVRPKDMEGHSYATWGLPVEQATVKQVVEADGGDFSKVALVPYEVDDEVMGLQAGLFDTVWVYEWWAVQNAKLQEYPVNYFAFGDISPQFDFYTPVIAANDAFAAAHPELVRAFLRACEQGYEFAATSPEQAAEIFCQAVPELDPALIAAAQASISPQYIADAGRWGVIDRSRWSRFYEWLNDAGLVENGFDPTLGFTNEYLEG